MSPVAQWSRPPASAAAVFLGFLSIGARAFGGVLPWAHRVIVEERCWLSPREFAETLALCQLLPGPNVGNLAIVLGRRWFGLRGAIAAYGGLMALPFVGVLALAVLYTHWAAHPAVQTALTGTGVAAGGLFLGTAFRMGRGRLRSPAALAVATGSFVAAGPLALPVPLVLLGALALAWLGVRVGAMR